MSFDFEKMLETGEPLDVKGVRALGEYLDELEPRELVQAYYRLIDHENLEFAEFITCEFEYNKVFDLAACQIQLQQDLLSQELYDLYARRPADPRMPEIAELVQKAYYTADLLGFPRHVALDQLELDYMNSRESYFAGMASKMADTLLGAPI